MTAEEHQCSSTSQSRTFWGVGSPSPQRHLWRLRSSSALLQGANMSSQYGNRLRRVSTWQLNRKRVSHYDSAHKHGSRRNYWHLARYTTPANLLNQTSKTLKTFVLPVKNSFFELFTDFSLRWVWQVLIKDFGRFTSVAKSWKLSLWSLDAWLKMAHHTTLKMLRLTRCLYPWYPKHWSVSSRTWSHNYQRRVRPWSSCRSFDVFRPHATANFWIGEVESAMHSETRNQLTPQ